MVNIVSHWLVDGVDYFKVENRKLCLFCEWLVDGIDYFKVESRKLCFNILNNIFWI